MAKQTDQKPAEAEQKATATPAATKGTKNNIVLTRDIPLGEGTRKKGDVLATCHGNDIDKASPCEGVAERELATLKLNGNAYEVRPASSE